MDEFKDLTQYSQIKHGISSVMRKKMLSSKGFEGTSSLVYIFLENSELFVSRDGIVDHAIWRLIGNSSILISENSPILYDILFIDNEVLVLKQEGTSTIRFFVSAESKMRSDKLDLMSLRQYLDQKYYVVDDIQKDRQLYPEFQVKADGRGYNLRMGWYRKFFVKTESVKMSFYQKESSGKFYLYHKNDIVLFDNEDICVSYILKNIRDMIPF